MRSGQQIKKTHRQTPIKSVATADLLHLAGRTLILSGLTSHRESNAKQKTDTHIGTDVHCYRRVLFAGACSNGRI